MAENDFKQGDWVVNSYLNPSLKMLVVKDFDSVSYGCRYYFNGVFHYAEFERFELSHYSEPPSNFSVGFI